MLAILNLIYVVLFMFTSSLVPQAQAMGNAREMNDSAEEIQKKIYEQVGTLDQHKQEALGNFLEIMLNPQEDETEEPQQQISNKARR